MSETKGNKNSLRQSLDDFNTIVDRFNGAIYVADIKTYELLYVNQYVRERFGDPSGKKCWEYLQKGMRRPCPFCTNAKLIDESGKSTGVYVWEFQNTIDKRWYECRDQVVNWHDGRQVRLEMATDVTLKKETEEALRFEIDQRKQVENQLKVLVSEIEAANAELEDFAYIVSHDLKAPLRGIASLVTWLSEDYSHVIDETGRDLIGKMQTRTKLLSLLIDGILHYSRLGRAKIEPQALDSHEIVTDIIDELAIPKHYKVIISDTLPTIVYDRTFFTQLMQNLIQNAAKHHGKPQGTITISCHRTSGYWEFSVQDDGIGIEEKHFEKIFKIFQILNPKENTESSGIGLALVKKIIDRSGGKVWVESEVGKGSTFYFTIPIATSTKTGRKNATVLLIDDNVEFIEIAATMLERDGHHILTAASGHEAFELLKSYNKDVYAALVDLRMPGENSADRFATLRKLRPQMKIILCSGLENNEIQKFLETGLVDGILKKPFKLEELKDILDVIPGKKNQEKAI